MIINFFRQDIVTSPHRHIAFAISCDGQNAWGIPLFISNHFGWPELTALGGDLGEIRTRELEDRTLHAIVCYGFGLGGWAQTPTALAKALRPLHSLMPPNDVLAMVAPGMKDGQLYGADPVAIINAIAESPRRIALYTV